MQTAPTRKTWNWRGPLGPSPWTAAISETTRANWANGVSASAIGVILRKLYGVELSRSAVVGKAHRNKWKTPQSPGGCNGSHQAGECSVVRKRNRRPSRPKLLAAHNSQFPTDDRPLTADTTESLNVEMLDLAPHACHYPTGENEYRYLFCGQPQAEGYPYCCAHAQLSYRETREIAPRNEAAIASWAARKPVGVMDDALPHGKSYEQSGAPC